MQEERPSLAERFKALGGGTPSTTETTAPVKTDQPVSSENADLKDEKSIWDAHVLRQSQPGHRVEQAFKGNRPVKINAGG